MGWIKIKHLDTGWGCNKLPGIGGHKAMDDRARRAIYSLTEAFDRRAIYPFPKPPSVTTGQLNGFGGMWVNWCPVEGHLWSSRRDEPVAAGMRDGEVPCPEHDGAMAPSSESPDQAEGWKMAEVLADPYDTDNDGVPATLCGW